MKVLRWLLVLLAVARPAAAQVQQPNAVGGGGAGGGTVAQGTAAATTDAAAWPMKVVFGSAQIDPRDITDRAARLLGHITVDNSSIGVTQSGSWSFSFTAPQHVIADSGTLTVQQATGSNLHVQCDSGCGGAASFNDNSAFTFGTTAVNNMGAVVDDTATNSVTENSAGAPRMSSSRVLYSNLRDAGGNEVASSTSAPAGTERGVITRNVPSGTQTVSGTVTANAGTGTFTVSGTVTSNQGTANTAANRWPVYVTDGTNTMPTADAAARRQYVAIANGGTELGTAGAGTGLTVTCTNCGSSVSQRTYHAVAQPGSITFTSGTGKAVACVMKTAAMTTRYELLNVRFAAGTHTVAQTIVELRRITADGTGTSLAANILPADPGDAAVNASLVAKHTYTVEPTYAAGGYTAYAFSTSTANNVPLDEILLYQYSTDGGRKPLALRNGQQEGWCVFVTMTGTSPALTPRVTFVFTEQ